MQSNWNNTTKREIVLERYFSNVFFVITQQAKARCNGMCFSFSVEYNECVFHSAARLPLLTKTHHLAYN